MVKVDDSHNKKVQEKEIQHIEIDKERQAR